MANTYPFHFQRMREKIGFMKVRQHVYDTYWKFAYERQEIFFKRMHKNAPPYTSDPILQTYKFCNVYRATDRVSQFLIRNVIYDQDRSPEETLFRILLFRLLNKNETWTALEEQVGEISLHTFSFHLYDKVLTELSAHQPIYGNAFILCANKVFGFERKHQNHVKLLEHIFVQTDLSKQIIQASSLKNLFVTLRGLPLLGNFMAYQLAIDFTYSPFFAFDEDDFTIAGPGALRGIRKCFEDTGGISDTEIIQYMVKNQEQEFERLGLKFQTLGGRRLHAIDCQGLFCEVDKYSRVKFPELKSSRSRIKSTYTPHQEPIHYVFPPKWHITFG